jgi:hypothetical protein
MNVAINKSSSLLIIGNKLFLNKYKTYVYKDWQGFYFHYDYLKKEYIYLFDSIDNNKRNINKYDLLLYDEIQRIDIFLLSLINQIRAILVKLNSPNHDNDDDFAKASIEITLRFIFEKINKIETFYKLNSFAICKIAKKLEKILDIIQQSNNINNNYHNNNNNNNIELSIDNDNDNNIDKDFIQWKKLSSYNLYKNNLLNKKKQIELIQNEIINTYTKIFRSNFKSLAINELEFPKQKSGEYRNRDSLIGFKFGLIFSSIVWIAADSIFVNTDAFFWNNPALFIYSAIFNMLLYRFLWSLNIFYWAKYEINYITMLKLSTKMIGDVKFIIDESSTLLLLLTANILIFFRAHIQGSNIYYSFFNYASPFLLIVIIAIYFFYQTFMYKKIISRGLINIQVLKRCFSSPFVPVQFRDNYAADVLTSFNKVISDALYGTCWVISGSFLINDDDVKEISVYENFGANGINCTGKEMSTLVGIIVIIPLWIRAMQCIRNFYDHDCNVYTHIQNLIKYLLSISVVIVGLISENKFDDDFDIYDVMYFTLIVITSLYKWYWDVIMDWGLFKNSCFKNSSSLTSPNSNNNYLFLRDILMYPNHYTYYLAIFMDLIGRFLWTVALVPNSYKLMPNLPLLSIVLGININKFISINY